MSKHAWKLLALLVLLPAAGYAAELKIGFVNQERILRESSPAKRAQAKLDKEFATRRAELDRMEKQEIGRASCRERVYSSV